MRLRADGQAALARRGHACAPYLGAGRHCGARPGNEIEMPFWHRVVSVSSTRVLCQLCHCPPRASAQGSLPTVSLPSARKRTVPSARKRASQRAASVGLHSGHMKATRRVLEAVEDSWVLRGSACAPYVSCGRACATRHLGPPMADQALIDHERQLARARRVTLEHDLLDHVLPPTLSGQIFASSSCNVLVQFC